MSLIPIFGSILSSVPIVAVALISSGTFDLKQGVKVLVWIILIHLIEANFLNPKIMGDAAKIHPVLVVFALIAGEHSYGLVGALFAVPVASIIQTIFVYYRRRPKSRWPARRRPPSRSDAADECLKRRASYSDEMRAAGRRRRSAPSDRGCRATRGASRRRGWPRRRPRAAPRAGCAGRCAADRCDRWRRGRPGSPRCLRRGGSASGYAHPVATKQRPLVAASAIFSDGEPDDTSSRSTNARLLRSADVHGGGRRRRLIEESGVVQEREEQMEEVLARRQAADVAAQERRRALQHALAHALERRRARRRRSNRRATTGSGTDRRPRRARSRPSCRRRVAPASGASPTRPTSASARVSRARP